jgi:hypothetical protein
MSLAGLFLRGLGWRPGNELVAVRIGEAAESNLVGMVQSFGCRSEGYEGSGGGEDDSVHCS